MESYYTIINDEKVCINTNIANGILNDLTVDDILLRWFNLHLLRSGNAKPTMGLIGGSIYESLPNYAYLLCELRHKLSSMIIYFFISISFLFYFYSILFIFFFFFSPIFILYRKINSCIKTIPKR